MKQTQKYTKACNKLTFPHQNQDELYQELNRLGWYWNSKIKEWERDDTPAKEATQLIKIRVWASSNKVKLAADLLIEQMESVNFELLEKSEPYACRPPLQLESRIYLTFKDKDSN